MRGGNVLAKAAVGVVFEHARAFRREAKIAVEGIGGAGNCVARTARSAGAAVSARIDIHPVTDLEVVDLSTYCFDDT
ncbi:hypothetical protein D3C87_1978550 [compost metagenome]